VNRALDFADEIFQTSPWSLYDHYTASEPVAWSSRMQCYFVFGYENVRAALVSPHFTTFSAFRRTRTAIGPSALDVDGETHARLRGALAPAFRPAAVGRYAVEIVSPAVSHLLDELLATNRTDWLPEFAARLPVRVAASIVGLPQGAEAYLHKTMRPLVEFIDHGAVDYAMVVARRDELRDYLRSIMREPIPADSVIRILGDGGLAESEIVDNALLTLVAATETTSSSITNVVARIAGQPGLFEFLRLRPDLIDKAIGETLRHEPPLHLTVRFTNTAVMLAGRELPAGSPVQVCLASANRDKAVYRDPHTWDLHREGRAPLTFGAGPHHCLGSGLAHVEIKALVRELLYRFRSLEVLSPENPTARGRTFRRVPDLQLG
jgi:cytochrome P450